MIEFLYFILMGFMAILAIAGLAAFFNTNTDSKKPLREQNLTVAEVRALNQQYAAKRAKRQIETERGKILAFKRKDYYPSSRPKK